MIRGGQAMREPEPCTTPSARLPHHVAIVMDGNGRWAQRRKRPRTFGHRAGVRAVRGAIESCLRRGIATLTLFAFSSENWSRPAPEVKALFELFFKALEREIAELHQHGVRVHFIGEVSAFPEALQRRMRDAQDRTRGNHRLHLNIAINYGGHWDIVQACRQLIATGAAPESIEAQHLAAHLSLAGQSDPDLFIRTGGERRLSNFLVWQLAYAELYFTDTLWPDFDDACFAAALEDFAQRERRYGKTSAQVQAGS